MALIKYNRLDPWRDLENLHEELNKLFNVSFGSDLVPQSQTRSPMIDVWEDEKQVYVEADLPGFEQKDVKVSLKDDVLVISGQKEARKEETKKNYFRCERYKGRFYRSIGLPSSVDASKVKAQYKQGILHIEMGKKQNEGEKEISIDVG